MPELAVAGCSCATCEQVRARYGAAPTHAPKVDLDALLYCLNEGYDAPLITAMLTLADSRDLDKAWQEFARWSTRPPAYLNADFSDAVTIVTSDKPYWCDQCNDLLWRDDTSHVDDDTLVCRSCLDSMSVCYWCENYFSSNDLAYVADHSICDSCLEGNYSWCEECEEYIDNDDDHWHGCDCEAPRQSFQFPNGAGCFANDERVTIELPAGTIDDEGLSRIITVLQGVFHQEPWRAATIVAEVGPMWQTRRGNFTRRLSSAVYKADKALKLDSETLASIGNIAQQHSSKEASWSIEVTRDLNQSAKFFYHARSCWWGSYGDSRCALKHWGGFGLRSFGPTDAPRTSDAPEGRAWVQPLDAEMTPTHDAINAHAYVVYNGYGALSGYVAARLIAHLTGKTYRPIEFEAPEQYVNGDRGYLVADEATCADTTSIALPDRDIHYDYDAHQAMVTA